MHHANSPRDHQALYEHTLVYYVFSFAFEERVDLYDVASKLLAAEVAETLSSPISDDVRVSPRYKALEDILDQAQAISDFHDVQAGKNSLVRWALRHPGMAASLTSSVVRGGRRRNGEAPHTTNARPEKPALETVDEVLGHITRTVAHEQASLAIQHHVQSRMYRPSYLESEPFLRLGLRGTRQWWVGASDDQLQARDGFTADALLLLHRSGVMQLTLAMRLPERLSTDELLPFLMAGTAPIQGSSVPEPLLRAGMPPGPDESWLGEWEPEVVGGARWRKMLFDPTSDVSSLFALYREAIQRTSGAALVGEWSCYPVVCVEEPGCCSIEEAWRINHERDLLMLTTRFQGHSELRESASKSLGPKESSIVQSHSLFATYGVTVRIRWNSAPEKDDFASQLWTLLLVEIALLQVGILRALESRLDRSRDGGANIHEIHRQAVYDLVEYRSGVVTYDTANDIVRELLEAWRADRLHSLVSAGIEQMQELSSTEASLRAARQSNAVALLAFIAAVILGIPAIAETFNVLTQLPSGSDSPEILNGLRSIGASGPEGILVAYALVVLASGAILGVIPLRNRSKMTRGQRRSPLPGRPWRLGTVEIVESPYSRRPTDESSTPPPSTYQA